MIIRTDRAASARRRNITVVATTVAVIMAILGIVAVPRATGRHTPPSAASPAPTGPTSVPPATGSASAAATLERLAENLDHAPADSHHATFEYIDHRVWEAPPASPASASGAPLSTGPGRRIQLWNTGRGRSRQVVIDETRGCPPESDGTSDELRPFDGPLSSDPDAVRRQILREPVPSGTYVDIFGQVAFLFSERFVPLTTRQGILRMLARLPDVDVRTDAVDPLGRPGFAVSWTYRPPMPFTVDKSLVFDTRTGQLLSSHSHAHRRPEAVAPPDPMQEYESVMVVLAATYTPDTRSPARGCPT